jgi:arylsulfatase A-like enzyme
MKKKITFITIALIPLVAFGLWPLQSDTWDIQWDEDLIAGKADYLNEPVETDSTSPNVLLIVVDDLSLADISVYKDDAPVVTPHIQRIADRGVRFTNAYVTHSICSPSRAAMLTGRYPQRYGFEHQMHDRYLKNRLEYMGFKYFVKSDPWIPQSPKPVPDEEAIEKQGLPPSEITLAEALKKGGYSTGLIGKWHLGYADFNQPCAMGFDEFFGFNASHSLYAPEGTPGIVDQRIEGDWTDPFIWSGQRSGPHAITIDCDPIKEPDYLTFRIAEESIAYMERHKGEQFFLMSSFNAPHTPLQAPEEYVRLYADEPDPVKRVHYAMIKALDDAIGDLLKYLEKSKLNGNTMVILISDNGGAEYNLTTDNGPLRGGKVTDFEGGLKVPMLMQWSKLPSGVDFSQPVLATDIFTTAINAAGIPQPRDRTIDGADILHSIGDSIKLHDQLFWRKGYNSAVRDSRWKMTWNEQYGDTLLYDLREDPFESNNIFGTQPEVQETLFASHRKWARELPGPAWPSLIDYYYEEDGVRYWFDN